MAYRCGNANPPPGTCIPIPAARKQVLVDEDLEVLKDETINALKVMIRDAWGVNEDDILWTSRPGTAHEIHIYDENNEDDERRLDFDDDFTYALIRPDLVAGKPNLLEDIRHYILGQQGGRRYRRKTRKSRRQRRRSLRHRRRHQTRRH
jgi:hypothetical protein